MSGPLVVIGDALLDVDLVGKVSRIAPDAPVPVVSDVQEHARPGGAALAALLAARDGLEVVLVTPLADDAAADQLVDLLDGVRIIAVSCGGGTAVKTRVRAGGQSLVRIDTGAAGCRLGPLPAEVREALDGASAVLVSDYGRGTTSSLELRELLTGLPGRLPVVWDPHPRGGDPTPGLHLVTPNAKEAREVAARSGGDRASELAELAELAAVRRDAEALVVLWRSRAVAVTLGARGALLSYGDGAPVVTSAPHVEAVDPCGAGDRFAVSAAASLGAGAVLTEAVQEAVRAASAYVAADGPASLRTPPTGEQSASHGARRSALGAPRDAVELAGSVRGRGGVVAATGGCFDLLHAGHVATLRAARRLGDCLIVCVNSDESVRRLKGPSRPVVPVEDRVRVLEALECVDAVVVFDEDTPAEVLDVVRPHVWAKGGDYAGAKVPEAAVLDQWGGQVVALPYLAGRSTTALVGVAATSEPAATLRSDVQLPMKERLP